MKKVVISIILTLFFINGVCLVIFLGNLYIVKRNFQRNIIINESLNARLELYDKIFKLSKVKAEEEIDCISAEIKKTISSCKRCHQVAESVWVVNTVEDLEKELDTLKKDKRTRASLFPLLEDFSRMALERGRLSYMLTTGELKASLNTIMITLLLISFSGGGTILYFSIYSLRRVAFLEKDIKEKEKTITDWALEWQETFDSVKDMIIILDEKGRPKAFNTSAGGFFKDGLLREDFCRYFLNLKCPCQGSDRIVIRDRIFDMAVYKMKDDTTRCIIVLRDITEQKEMEEKLQRVERLVSLGTMAGGIAHEINNPLTAVVGFSELLLIHEADENKKKFLDEILKAAKRIQKIVHDLLAFGRKGELSFDRGFYR
ncbi:MAG: histidine kinase dimerization/phospho-acceptor domain-containing protein [Thermodesulfovibrionales bacterium]